VQTALLGQFSLGQPGRHPTDFRTHKRRKAGSPFGGPARGTFRYLSSVANVRSLEDRPGKSHPSSEITTPGSALLDYQLFPQRLGVV
jgi:hypothetical protein